MSGHSKFANIAHKKAANDAAKGKIFTRLGKEIMVAVKEGGPDVNNNSKLRQVVTKCKAANMPNDTIDRAIKKAASTDMSDFESVTYEGYGPNGTAIIVEALTDNRNRAASNIRNAFTKGGGNVGTPGCVSFMFDNKGQIIVDKEECDKDADDLMMLALDAGADDFTLIYPAFPTNYKMTNTIDDSLEYGGRFEEALVATPVLRSSDKPFDTDIYMAYLYGNPAFTHIENLDNEDGLNICLIKDSFAVPFAAFTSLRCHTIDMIDPRYYEGDYVDAVMENDYDYVIVMISPQDLVEEFFPFGVEKD